MSRDLQRAASQPSDPSTADAGDDAAHRPGPTPAPTVAVRDRASPRPRTDGLFRDRLAGVDEGNAALFTDLYQLTMLDAYRAERMDETAIFHLYFRTLPEGRDVAVAAGLEPALDYLETLHAPPAVLEALADRDDVSDALVEELADLSFTGTVRALPEGTPVFPDEPLIEVEAPLPEAQLAETFLMNQVCFQTVLASKAARVVEAAGDRAVVDFGMRRMHGTDAALQAARVFHLVGVDATSNVLAGERFDLPVTGTMAHSYIQAHDDELEAFRQFATVHPETVLLVDTYDTRAGVEKVVALAEELGDDFEVSGIRLDSGDLGELAADSRRLLDDAGLEDVEVFASGGLDEHGIRRLLEAGAPIDGFGVGTRMGVSRDAPSFDMAYKLVAYDGRGRLKLSSGKRILPGAKQVFRVEEEDGDGEPRAVGDVIARADEDVAGGRPLLETVMVDGRRTEAGRCDTERSRRRFRRAWRRLPEAIRSVEAAEEPYPVEVSDALRAHQEEVAARVA